MSERLKHRQNLRDKLEAAFGNPGGKPDETSRTERVRTVLPMLGGSGPYEYDFSPNEYLLRRWRREVEERRMSPAYKRRLRKVQDLFH